MPRYAKRTKPHGSGPAFPKMMYDPATGDATIFQAAEDVLPGWVTSDDLEVPHSGKIIKRPAALTDEAPAKQDQPWKGAAKALGLSKKEIVALLEEAEVEFDKSHTADQLAYAYEEHLVEPDDETEDDETADADETED